jgi:translation initiation factor 2 subunit 1
MTNGRQIPQLGELVVGRIKEVKNYGAYVELDEYPGVEALIHVSEISLKWVRNIRDHLKEGQRNIFKVIRVNPDSMQVDISLRRVSKREREEKLLEIKKKQKVQVIIKSTVEKTGSHGENLLPKLLESVGGDFLRLYDVFEEISEGRPARGFFPNLDEGISKALESVISEEIRRREAVVKGELSMRCDGRNGVEVIRNAVIASEALAGPSESIEIKVKGPPIYTVWVRASTAERASELLQEVYKKCGEMMAAAGGVVEAKAA